MTDSNPRSRLVEPFNRQMSEELAATDEGDDQDETIGSAEQALEEIEALLNVDWYATAIPRIEDFEAEHGIDFGDLAADAPGIDDPRARPPWRSAADRLPDQEMKSNRAEDRDRSTLPAQD